MKRYLRFVAIVLFFALAGKNVQAETKPGTKAGRLELKGSPHLRYLDFNDRVRKYGLGIEVNYFLTDNFSVGVGSWYNHRFYNDYSWNEECNHTGLLGRGDFYFVTRGRVITHAGFHVGRDRGNFESHEYGREYMSSYSSFFYGIQGGVKIFVTERIAFGSELRLSYSRDHRASHPNHASLLDLLIGELSISYFF